MFRNRTIHANVEQLDSRQFSFMTFLFWLDYGMSIQKINNIKMFVKSVCFENQN